MQHTNAAKFESGLQYKESFFSRSDNSFETLIVSGKYIVHYDVQT